VDQCGVDQPEIPEAEDHELNSERTEQGAGHPGDDLKP
jgi:hypothetical protein